MSYESENYLSSGTSTQDVIKLLETLDYTKIRRPKVKTDKEIAQYYWYETKDYKSWSGVELSIFKDKDSLVVYTRTPVSRSYWDLEKQNNTIKLLRKRFGGHFNTDEGKNRYFQVEDKAPTPQQSGCYLAFERFGFNLIKADIYLMNRSFPNKQWEKTGVFEFIDQINPRLLSNNLLIPYLVSVIEDYFKSTFIALLKYSKKKESFFKNVRITSPNLAKISVGELSVEEAVAETLPFQRISAICRHFKTLDSKLDLAGVLRKPYHRRKKKLFEEIEEFVEKRHSVIHWGEMDTQFSDKELMKTMKNLEDSIIRCYRAITNRYGWKYERSWSRGKHA